MANNLKLNRLHELPFGADYLLAGHLGPNLAQILNKAEGCLLFKRAACIIGGSHNRFSGRLFAHTLHKKAIPKFSRYQVGIWIETGDVILPHCQDNTQVGIGFHGCPELDKEIRLFFPGSGVGGKEFFKLVDNQDSGQDFGGQETFVVIEAIFARYQVVEKLGQGHLGKTGEVFRLWG